MNSHQDKSFVIIRSFFMDQLETLASLVSIFNLLLKSVPTATCRAGDSIQTVSPRSKRMILPRSQIQGAVSAIAAGFPLGPTPLQYSWHLITARSSNTYFRNSQKLPPPCARTGRPLFYQQPPLLERKRLTLGSMTDARHQWGIVLDSLGVRLQAFPWTQPCCSTASDLN